MKLTIGRKLNGFIILSLLLSILSVVSISTFSFTEDLVGLLHKVAKDTSSLVSGRVRAEMKEISEVSTLLSSITLLDVKNDSSKDYFILDNLNLQNDIYALAIFRKTGLGNAVPKVDWRRVNPSFAKTRHFLPIDFERIDQQGVLNTAPVFQGQINFALAKLQDGSDVLRVGIPVGPVQGGSFSTLVVADLRGDLLTALFSESTSYLNYLVDRRGMVIGTSDPLKIPLGTTLEQLGISNQLDRNDDRVEYTDRDGDRQIMAAQKVGYADLTTISQTSYAKASSARKKLLVRAFFLGGTILCLTLALGFLFSQTLTTPITALAEAAEKVETGNFEVRVLKKANEKPNGDEIFQLSKTFDRMVSGLQEREKVKAALSTYHSKDLVDRVLTGDLKIGGERKDATVLFADIRGFTSLSESLDPSVVFQVLNEYFGVMVGIILKHGGHIDKFMGDGILAVWGVPASNSQDVDRALNCCLNMRAALVDLNESFKKRGLPELRFGMGLNHGPVMSGNIGSSERMEYTVIGDTVNTATRIETLTKLLGLDLLVSHTVLKNCSGHYVVEDLAGHHVKGKASTVRVFKVVRYAQNPEEANVKLLAHDSSEPDLPELPDAVDAILRKQTA